MKTTVATQHTQQHFKCDVIESNEAREEGDGGVEEGDEGHEGDDDGGHVQGNLGTLCRSPLKKELSKILIVLMFPHFLQQSYF